MSETHGSTPYGTPHSSQIPSSIFREINERIWRLSADHDGNRELELICECPDGACSAKLNVPREMYEQIRNATGRFIASSDHTDWFDRIVAEEDGYAVVETLR